MVLDESPALARLARDYAWGRRFIVWLGSGTSRSAGLPSWEQLRRKLESRLTAIAPRALPGQTQEERNDLVGSIRRLPDHWDAFEALKSRMPPADYRNMIKIALNSDAVEIPVSLLRIWANHNVDGLISTNIDNLGSRAFSSVFGGDRDLIRADGVNLRSALRLLSENPQFLVNLHGRVDDENSWIFTRSERDQLLQNPLYSTFITAALTARRVIFIGCSPDDMAVYAHFKRLKALAGNLPEHYWLVDQRELTPARRELIDEAFISPIEYDVSASEKVIGVNRAHEAAVVGLFDYIEDFQFSEPEPDPINPNAPPIGERYPPEKVQALAPEQARNLLSRYASAILGSDGAPDERAKEYSQFIRRYGPAIAVASYLPADEPDALFFGHQVRGEIGHGAFSRVFRALAPGGQETRAIKLVRSEVRDDPNMLRSFRRGVKSMQILSEQAVTGMVLYNQAHEIPPCVIMPFIEGDNLETLGPRPEFGLLDSGLPIIRRVAEIVSSAHDLPQRVLHRDLRPSNIMIRETGDDSPITERVVVLDFDLSWHEGADSDGPISPNMTTVLGYLAPEQISSDLTVSARHTKVDSYGLCMTLFYLVERRHPELHERSGAQWSGTLNRIGQVYRDRMKWKSLIHRVRRLIDRGTEPSQVDRLDFQVVLRELRLLEVLSTAEPQSVSRAAYDTLTLEALAEELFVQIVAPERYTWDSLKGSGSYNGARVAAAMREAVRDGVRGFLFEARKPFDGTQAFDTVRKYWNADKSQIDGLMGRGGWQRQESIAENYRDISISYFAPEEAGWSGFKNLISSGKQAWSKLNLH